MSKHTTIEQDKASMMLRRAVRVMAAAVLIWAACALSTAIHDQSQAARIDRARAEFEVQHAEAVQAIRETEDLDLKRLGLID